MIKLWNNYDFIEKDSNSINKPLFMIKDSLKEFSKIDSMG